CHDVYSGLEPGDCRRSQIQSIPHARNLISCQFPSTPEVYRNKKSTHHQDTAQPEKVDPGEYDSLQYDKIASGYIFCYANGITGVSFRSFPHKKFHLAG